MSYLEWWNEKQKCHISQVRVRLPNPTENTKHFPYTFTPRIKTNTEEKHANTLQHSNINRNKKLTSQFPSKWSKTYSSLLFSERITVTCVGIHIIIAVYRLWIVKNCSEVNSYNSKEMQITINLEISWNYGTSYENNLIVDVSITNDWNHI